jgi:integrase
MATLYTRKGKNGKIFYYVNYVVDGERVRKKVGRNRKVAELVLKDIEVKIEKQDAGLVVKDRRFKDFAREYLNHAKATRSLLTYEWYLSKIQRFQEFVGEKKLGQISVSDIEDFKAERLTEATPATVAGDLRAVKAMLSSAVARGYLRDNPCKKVKKVQNVRVNPPRFLSKEEVEKLIAVAEGTHLCPLIATAVYAGLRRNELVWLEWQDIDFERNTITVRNKEEFHTKSYKSRTIPLNEKLKEILLKYRKKSGWCFLNSEGGQFRNNLLKRFKAICKIAGIENCHLHTLRHTFSSQLVMAGVSIYKVSQWLGHSDVKTTMIYAHLAPQDADINRI